MIHMILAIGGNQGIELMEFRFCSQRNLSGLAAL